VTRTEIPGRAACAVGLFRQTYRATPDCVGLLPLLSLHHSLPRLAAPGHEPAGSSRRECKRSYVMNQRILTMTAISALVAASALAGCSKTEQQDAKNTTSGAVATVEQKAREVGNDATNAAAKMGEKIDDAVITTSVKGELAKDSNLSALKINVDTANGRVALKGTAPSTAAREKATMLAQNVKGVTSVDNQLTVQQ
jgi:hyperosmotically inducible protein